MKLFCFSLLTLLILIITNIQEHTCLFYLPIIYRRLDLLKKYIVYLFTIVGFNKSKLKI